MSQEFRRNRLQAQLLTVNAWVKLGEASNFDTMRETALRQARASLAAIQREQRIYGLLDQLFPELRREA